MRTSPQERYAGLLDEQGVEEPEGFVIRVEGELPARETAEDPHYPESVPVAA